MGRLRLIIRTAGCEIRDCPGCFLASGQILMRRKRVKQWAGSFTPAEDLSILLMQR